MRACMAGGVMRAARQRLHRRHAARAYCIAASLERRL